LAAAFNQSIKVVENMRFIITIACAFILHHVANAAQQPLTIDQLAPHAKGLCLAEVLDITEHDSRPSDGNLDLHVKLRVLKGSGEVHDFIYIILDVGGAGPGPRPILPDFLRRDSFTKGNQYWIAFASFENYEQHPQGVVNYWPKGKNAEVEKVLADAVRADVYRWSPRYDPKTKLTYGRLVDEMAEGDEEDEDQWRIQVQREGKILWETVVPGTISKRSFSWTLDPSADANFPGKVPPCGKMLVAETARRLPVENEFGLPPQMVYVQTGYDPETGVRLTARVTRHQDGDVLLLYREYDAKTGAVEKETRANQ
jgi:hypothetical protein